MFRSDQEAAQIAKAELERELAESAKEIARLNQALEAKKQKERSNNWEMWPIGDVSRFFKRDWFKVKIAWISLFLQTKTFRLICLLLASIGLFVGFVSMMTQVSCTPSLPGGHITNLFHHHPFTTHYTTCTGGTNNQPRVCTPHTIYHPEKWSAIVCDEGRCEHPYYSEEDWNALHVGQWICLQTGCVTHPDREELYNRD